MKSICISFIIWDALPIHTVAKEKQVAKMIIIHNDHDNDKGNKTDNNKHNHDDKDDGDDDHD